MDENTPNREPGHWHEWPVDDLARHLDTDLSTGLTPGSAAEALTRHGPNALPEGRRRSLARMIVDQFADFMILVLLAAAVVSGVVGERADTVTILVIVLLDAVIGVAQEYRAERAMGALRALASPHALVRREGEPHRIPVEDVVPGDVVLLEAGNVVPADLRLVEAARLTTQESALTGESQSVAKHSEVMPAGHLPVADRTNMAFKGTLVAGGRGVGLAVATGMGTELGGIARLLSTTETLRTPLQRRLARLGTRLALSVLVICAVVFAAGLLRGEPATLMFLTAISLAVAAIPEALPAVVAISLALGAYRMVGQQALVRRLPAVETLGSITTVCSDKTGTLTENRMRVEVVSEVEPQVRRALLECLVLCNDAEPRPSGQEAGEGLGEPTEVALLEVAVREGLDVAALRREMPRVAEVPFEATRKLMTTVHREGERHRVCVKGAPEAVLELVTRWPDGDSDVALDEETRRRMAKEAGGLAAEGMRVLAVAQRWIDGPVDTSEAALQGDLERDLELLGLVGLIDPPRAEAKDAVAVCRAAGITPVMITGDHPDTALAVARRLGICSDRDGDRAAQLVTGVELAALDDEALAKRVQGLRVCARVDPAQKIRIVSALQAEGEIVAMTGDGVNDAPALKRADIGVSMGRGGTDVARDASAMVLLDDNFATIVHAVREGRRIYDNIRKFVRYAMSGNSGEIWVIFLAPFLGLPIPLLPIHILWVNLVTDGLPGIMLAREEAEPDVMRRPPRPPRESVFAHGMWQHIIWVGLLMGGVCLLVQAAALAVGAHWQSMVFTVLTLSQLGHVMAIRSEKQSIVTLGWRTNPWLLATVLGTAALQLATLYLPALNEVFSTQALGLGELMICLAASSVVPLAVEVEKWFVRRGRLYVDT